MRVVAAIVLPAVLVSAGCEHRVDTESRTLTESVAYSDAEDQERFKQALSSAGIPYDVVIEQRNEEFVRWDASYTEAVERIQDAIFVPSGRSISFDAARQARFKSWLEHSGIPYRTMIEDNREHIVWEAADAERARSWEEFPSYYDDPPISPQR